MKTTDDTNEFPWPKPVAPSTEVSAAIREHCTCNLAKERGLSKTQRLLASLALSFGVFSVLAWITRGQVRVEGTFRNALVGAAG